MEMNDWLLIILVVAVLQTVLFVLSLINSESRSKAQCTHLDAIHMRLARTNVLLEEILGRDTAAEAERKWMKDVFMHVVHLKALQHTPTHAVPFMSQVRQMEKDAREAEDGDEDADTSPPEEPTLVIRSNG